MPVQPIVVDNATKVYGPIVAVDHLSFEISEGSVLALLGPNGAGKTTLIKILTTVAHASSGTAFIEGHDVRTERKTVRRLIGVVPQINNFDRFLTGRENLVLHAKMHGMPRSVYDRRIDELLEMVGLDKRQHDTPDKYSGGMQRRLIIARALVHQPRILFLDEPTTGLDPQSRRAVWDYVENLHGKATIMLTTHDMEEADQLSDRVIIMDNGRTLADGTSSELKQSIGVRAQYEIEVKRNGERYCSQLRESSLASFCQRMDNRLEISLAEGASFRDLICSFEEGDIARISTKEATLEDVFLHLTGHQLRD